MTDPLSADQRIAAALEVIENYGGIDGAHHKQWVIDQVVRALLGIHYERWVDSMTTGSNEGYEWNVGIAP